MQDAGGCPNPSRSEQAAAQGSHPVGPFLEAAEQPGRLKEALAASGKVRGHRRPQGSGKRGLTSGACRALRNDRRGWASEAEGDPRCWPRGEGAKGRVGSGRRPGPGPYDVQLQVVAEARGAVHAHQHGAPLVRAEAHGQAVHPRARPVIGGPRVGDERSPLPEDVRGPGCRERKGRGR